MKNTLLYISVVAVAIAAFFGYDWWKKQQDAKNGTTDTGKKFVDKYVDILDTPTHARAYAASFKGELNTALDLFKRDNFVDFNEKIILVGILYNNITDAILEFNTAPIYTATERTEIADDFYSKNVISFDIIEREPVVVDAFNSKFDTDFLDKLKKYPYKEDSSKFKKVLDLLTA